MCLFICFCESVCGCALEQPLHCWASCVHLYLWVCVVDVVCACKNPLCVCGCVCERVKATDRGEQQQCLMAAEAEQQQPDISACWVWLQPAREGKKKNESWKEREREWLSESKTRQKGAKCNKKTVWEFVCEHQRENKRVSVINKGWKGSVKMTERETKKDRINQCT